MAGVTWSTNCTVTTTNATTVTLLQLIAASNHRVLLKGCCVSIAGTVATDAPHQMELVIQTTAGTSSALAVNKDPSEQTETLEMSALQGFSSTEPTTTTVRGQMFVHPQTRAYFVLPPGGLPIIGGTRLGVRVVTPGVGYLTSVHVWGEE